MAACWLCFVAFDSAPLSKTQCQLTRRLGFTMRVSIVCSYCDIGKQDVQRGKISQQLLKAALLPRYQ